MDSSYYVSTSYGYNAGSLLASIGIGGIILSLIIIEAIQALVFWKLFKKAGKKGWISLIPIYNVWVFLEISGLKGWYCLIPFANYIFILIAYYKIAGKFGKESSFGILNIFFPIICLPILGFGDAKYESQATTADQQISSTVAPEQSPIPMPEQTVTPSETEELVKPLDNSVVTESPVVTPVEMPSEPIAVSAPEQSAIPMSEQTVTPFETDELVKPLDNSVVMESPVVTPVEMPSEPVAVSAPDQVIPKQESPVEVMTTEAPSFYATTVAPNFNIEQLTPQEFNITQQPQAVPTVEQPILNTISEQSQPSIQAATASDNMNSIDVSEQSRESIFVKHQEETMQQPINNATTEMQIEDNNQNNVQ